LRAAVFPFLLVAVAGDAEAEGEAEATVGGLVEAWSPREVLLGKTIAPWSAGAVINMAASPRRLRARGRIIEVALGAGSSHLAGFALH